MAATRKATDAHGPHSSIVCVGLVGEYDGGSDYHGADRITMAHSAKFRRFSLLRVLFMSGALIIALIGPAAS